MIGISFSHLSRCSYSAILRVGTHESIKAMHQYIIAQSAASSGCVAITSCSRITGTDRTDEQVSVQLHEAPAIIAGCEKPDWMDWCC